MRVLFIARNTLYTVKGGDTVQLENTAKFLRKLGVHIDVKLSAEEIDYSSYDLLHFFNVIRPADIISHIKKSNKPYVVSTIYLDFTEFEKNARTGIIGVLAKIFSPFQIDYLKTIARWILNGEKIQSTDYLWWGQKKSMQYVVENSKVLLPNSLSEYQRFVTDTGMEHKYKVIPNAYDAEMYPAEVDETEKEPNLVSCVARIEGRKNQLNLIRALNNTPFQVKLVGTCPPNHVTYFEACKAEAAQNIEFIQHRLTDAELIDLYRKSKVHVLCSWGETTGLSTLEAAAMKCNVVITDKGDTVEYFEDYAFYCNPDSPASIREAVEKAASVPFNNTFREKIRTQYTWNKTAELTLEAYNEALQKGK